MPEITLQEMLNELLKPGYVEKLQVVNKEYCRVFVRRTAGHSSGDGQSMQGTGAYGGVGVGTSSQQQQKRDPEYVIQLGPLDTFEFRVEHFQKMLGISSENYVPIQYTTESQEDTGNTVVAATLQWTMSVAMTIVLPMFILSRVMGRMRGGGMGGPGGGKGGVLGGMFGGMGQEKKKWEQTSTLRFKDVAGLQQ